MSMAYLWLNLSGADPLRGLTQRVAIVIILGWYSFASYHLLRSMGLPGGTGAKATGAEPSAMSRP